MRAHMYAFIAADPDTMTLAEAMDEPDKAEFLQLCKSSICKLGKN